MKCFNLLEIELLGDEGMEGDPLMKGLEPFPIGDILGDPSVKGFTLEDMELFGVEGVGGDPVMKGLEPFEIGDILGDPSVK